MAAAKDMANRGAKMVKQLGGLGGFAAGAAALMYGISVSNFYINFRVSFLFRK